MQPQATLITGAGRGIGRAAAIELAAEGYALALLARNETELKETAALAGRGLVIPTDVTQPTQIENAIQQAIQEYGRLDAIVHCAGVAPVRSIEQMSVEEWRQVIDTNLSAAFYLCHYAWPQFRRQQSGVVVNISSEASRDPFAGFAAYGSAKAAVNLFGRCAAREGQAIGVRVHTLAPAAVESAMFRQFLTPEQYPTEKTLSPTDVGRVIVQCVRGELRYASGEVIFLHKVI
jgi:NAD(P)-dependent dehydrogenase (short-subunit alcohol dehydrogenase family)